MNLNAFGDLARTMLAQSQSKALKTDQTRLSTELSTGLTTDPVKHLRADLTVLADMTQKRALSEQYLQTNREVQHLFDIVQATVSTIQDTTQRLVDTLIVTTQSKNPSAIDRAADEAKAAIVSVTNALNVEAAGRFVFAGDTTDTAPLVTAEDVLGAIEATLAGATDATDVQLRLDAFFAPGGGFEASVYVGSTQDMDVVRTSDTSSVQLDLRADDQAFRDMFKAAALSLAATEVSGLPRKDQDALLSASFSKGIAARDALVELTGDLGFVQGKLEQTQVNLQTQIASAELVTSELLAVDPFEAASRLEDVNARLEFLYAVTARARNLSFLEYMR